MDRSRDLGRVTLTMTPPLRAWIWALSLAACATPQPPAASAAKSDAALRGLEYTFRLDPELKRLSVELCMAGQAPARLVYGSRSAVPFMVDSQLVAEGGIRLPVPRALPLVDDHIQLGSLADDSCIRYDVDLGAALERDHLLVAYPCERGLVTSTELFLWRPPRRAADLPARARFVLPEGLQASVPWQRDERDPNRYLLDETAFAFMGHAIFGVFRERNLSIPSGTIRALTPGGFSDAQLDSIATWLENAGRVVSLPAGRFPVPRVQVIVVPTSPSVFPIRFGHTGRSGGASVLIFMPTDIDLANLRQDWIAIHEFSHLLHPFVVREDAWLSEGIATYLQEVLRVRAGMLSETEAWRRLYEGAALGASGEGGLIEETKRMAYAGNYQRVYWAGAAIALMADVELRRRGGEASLDRALAGLLARQDLKARPANAATLLAALDQAVGGTTFRDLAARYAGDEPMPDLAETYRQLGVVGATGAHRDGPLARLRDAIMKREDPSRFPLGGS